MEILTRSRCAECGGEGVVIYWAWAEFYKWEKEMFVNDVPDQSVVEEWFRNKGFSALPKEEIDCGYCEGGGFVSEWMPVSGAVDLLDDKTKTP